MLLGWRVTFAAGVMLADARAPTWRHRSALTDCQKLVSSGFDQPHALPMYGYDYED
jgi:hypothetical protein